MIVGDDTGNELMANGPIPAIIPTCANADNDVECDLSDEWPDCSDEGSNPYDECGICHGGNADQDCAGVCFGNALIDDCGDCSTTENIK